MASISYLLAVLLLLLPSYGLCATLKVCPSGCTYVTISSAVSAASANDVISVSPGDYTESNQVTIAKNLTIAWYLFVVILAYYCDSHHPSWVFVIRVPLVHVWWMRRMGG